MKDSKKYFSGSLQSLDHTRISINCDQIETQPCNPDFYDYALLSPDWSWQKYTMYVIPFIS